MPYLFLCSPWDNPDDNHNQVKSDLCCLITHIIKASSFFHFICIWTRTYHKVHKILKIFYINPFPGFIYMYIWTEKGKVAVGHNKVFRKPFRPPSTLPKVYTIMLTLPHLYSPTYPRVLPSQPVFSFVF